MYCHSNSFFVADKMLFLFVWRIFSLTSVFRTCILVWMSELPWNRIVYFLESLALFLVPNLLSLDVNSSWVPVMQGLDLAVIHSCPACLMNLLLCFYCFLVWQFPLCPSVCSLRLRTLPTVPDVLVIAYWSILSWLHLTCWVSLGFVIHPLVLCFNSLVLDMLKWCIETCTFSNCVLRLYVM